MRPNRCATMVRGGGATRRWRQCGRKSANDYSRCPDHGGLCVACLSNDNGRFAYGCSGPCANDLTNRHRARMARGNLADCSCGDETYVHTRKTTCPKQEVPDGR